MKIMNQTLKIVHEIFHIMPIPVDTVRHAPWVAFYTSLGTSLPPKGFTDVLPSWSMLECFHLVGFVL